MLDAITTCWEVDLILVRREAVVAEIHKHMMVLRASLVERIMISAVTLKVMLTRVADVICNHARLARISPVCMFARDKSSLQNITPV